MGLLGASQASPSMQAARVPCEQISRRRLRSLWDSRCTRPLCIVYTRFLLPSLSKGVHFALTHIVFTSVFNSSSTQGVAICNRKECRYIDIHGVKTVGKNGTLMPVGAGSQRDSRGKKSLHRVSSLSNLRENLLN